MARRSLNSQDEQGTRMRNRIYTVAALLIIAAMFAIAYVPGYFGNKKNETVEIGIPVQVSTVAGVPEVNETIQPAPIAQAEQEPDLAEIIPIPDAERNAIPDVEPNPEAAELIAEAAAFISEEPSRITAARDRLNEALRIPMSARQRESVKEQLTDLSDKWLFSRTVYPDDELCRSYQVQPGDQLRIIGEQSKVPYEILMGINGITNAQALQAGRTIKVINGPFNVKVYRSTFTMDVYLQNTYVGSFPVGLGKPGRETPTGLWRVKAGGKSLSTTWRDPDTGRVYQPEDPDYPLGSRWIALEGLEGPAKGRTGFGIHGTKEPEQIGTAGSRGCIRLYNGDVIRIYDLLVPTHSLIRVEE